MSTTAQPALVKQIEELSVAHGSNVLVFSRHKFSTKLAKAMRPEIAKMFLTSEANDAIEIIRRLNKHPTADGIDLVILDSEPTAIKILEYINKRSKSHKFSSYPIISTLVLYNSNHVETDFKKNAELLGGLNIKYMDSHSSPVEVFKAVAAILYRRSIIDKAYRDIKQTQHSSAYPYLPIFETKNDEEEDDEEDSIMEELALVGANNHDHNPVGISSFELDDWSLNPTVLPPKLIEARVSTDIPVEIEQTDKSKLADLSRLIIERAAKDKAILSRITGERSGQKPAPPSSSSQSSIDSVLQLSSSHANSALTQDKLGTQKLPYHSERPNKRVNLLDIKRRPRWEAKPRVRGKKQGSGAGHSSSIDDAEVTLYFDRQPPDLSMQRTVGGLNKRQAEFCWNVFGAYGDVEKLKSLHDSSSIKHKAKKLDGSVRRSRQTMDSSSVGASSTSTFTNSTVSAQLPLLISIGDGQRPFTSPAGEISPFNMSPALSTELIRQRSSTLQVANGSQVNPIEPVDQGHFALDKQFDTYRRALQKAERMLKKLVSDTPPDVQIHNVLELDLSARNVNVWERGLLVEGQQAEQEGLLDHAVSSLTRAGINSKEPHLSRLFLGSLFFRLGRFLSAIDYYSEALRLISALRATAMYNKMDEFVGRYNRAISYFRTGNDILGIKDLEAALKLEPQHLKAMEVYAIVLRRLGRYDEAIRIKADAHALEMQEATEQDSLESPQRGGLRPRTSKLTGDVRLSVRALSRFNQDDVTDLPNKRGNYAMQHSVMRLSLRSIGSSSSRTSGKSSGRDALDSDRSQPIATVSDKVIAVEVPSDKAGTSLRGKKLLLRLQKETGNNNSEYIESLTAFKLLNGFKSSLFETLFVKPDVFQAALLVPPSKRALSDVEVIGTNLKLVHLLRNLSSGVIAELAAKVEYRTVLPKMEIYTQDTPLDALCIILKGSVQMKMEGHMRSTESIIIDPALGAGDTIGQLDLLFQQPDSSAFFVEVKKRLREGEAEVVRSNARKNQASDDHDESMLTRARTTTDSKSSPQKPLQAHGHASKKLTSRKEIFPIDRDPIPSMSSSIPQQTLKSNQRALSPGPFATYSTLSYSELLLIPEKEYNRLLISLATQEFRKCFEVLKSSGLFIGWADVDLVRMARMGMVRPFRQGAVIVEQKEAPKYLYFMLSGISKAFKRPNQIEVVERKLQEARAKAERYDLRYTYHHKLRNITKHVPVTEVLGMFKPLDRSLSRPSTVSILPSIERKHSIEGFEEESLESHAEIITADITSKITLSEAERYKLEVEIGDLEALLLRLQNQSQHQAEKVSDRLVDSCEIAALKWPMVFGEACILEPEVGVSRGRIVATTACDVFMIHKAQLQTFHIHSTFLERLKSHAVSYPSDDELVAIMAKDRAWKAFREAIVNELPKNRWPRQDDNSDPFI